MKSVIDQVRDKHLYYLDGDIASIRPDVWCHVEKIVRSPLSLGIWGGIKEPLFNHMHSLFYLTF